MVNSKLALAWKARSKLYVKGNKLRLKAEKMWKDVERNRLCTKDNKSRVKASEVWIVGSTYLMNGDKLWANAIDKVYGNIGLEWKNWDSNKNSYECYLETGEIFRP